MNILQKRTAFIVTAAFLLAFVFSIVSLSHYKGEEHLFSIQESHQLKKITNGISAPDNNIRGIIVFLQETVPLRLAIPENT